MNICISTSATIEVLSTTKILYVEAYDNYSKIYLDSKKVILSNDSLKKINDLLPDWFVRIHNSYIINIRHIDKYYRVGEVELISGVKLPVARRRKSVFLESLMNFNTIGMPMSA